MGMIIQNGKQYFPVYNDTEIKALPTVDTASGSIATFNTDLTENLVKCVADIDDTSTQCVFTYAEKYIRVTPVTPTMHYQNGIDITTYANGKITINGTATDTVVIVFNANPFTAFGDDTRKIKFNNDFISNATSAYFYNGSTIVDSWGMNSLNREYSNYGTLANKYIDKVGFRITSGTTINNGSLMIEFIVMDTATVETISFGETVSGGATIDLITGILTRNDDTIKSLGGRDIPALSGYYYFCDTGDTSVKYILSVGKAIS